MSPALKTEQGLLAKIELLGNRLPTPAVLFVWLCLIVVVASAIAAAAGLSAVHPGTGETLTAKSLLSGEGLRWAISNTVSNFVQFAPVGTVLVALLGIGVAEHSGLLAAVLGALVRHAKGAALTAAVVFAGVFSSLGADSGYVVLIPLAALLYRAANRPALAGIAAAFAGVSGGYSANLLLGPLDAILSGISTEALQLVAPGESVSVAANYYFMIASTFLITLVATMVSLRWVEPRLALSAELDVLDSGSSEASETEETAQTDSEAQSKGLRAVGVFSLVFIAALLWATVPEDGVLRHPDTGSLLRSPFISGLVTLISVYAGLAGILYGRITGRYSAAKNGNGESWVHGMEQSMATMAGYLVLMFFAAQFVNYFGWTGLGAIVAVKGAELLQALELGSTALLLGFVFIAASINLLIGSASAKWAILAPVFIPMLYLAGVSPEAVQIAYRIGDSSSNIITPLMPYFGVVVAFAQRHRPDCGIGTLAAMMLPYSLAFLACWSAMLLLWIAMGWPLGPA